MFPLLLLLLLQCMGRCSTQPTPTCTFPKFLQTGPREDGSCWIYHAEDHNTQGMDKYAMRICVGGGSFNVTVDVGIRKFQNHYDEQWTCLERRPGHAIIVQKKSSKAFSEPSYSCVKFEKFGKDIVTMKRSNDEKQRKHASCDWGLMYPDDFPMFRLPKKSGEDNLVGSLNTLVGGYDVTYKDMTPSGTAMCLHRSDGSHIEVSCDFPNIMSMKFGKTCEPFDPLIMFKMQDFRVISAWEQEGFKFMLWNMIGRNDTWCVRFKEISQTKYIGAMFNDVQCPIQKTLDPGSYPHIQVNLTRQVIKSLCQDVWHDCSNVECGKNYDTLQCLESCKVCDPNEPFVPTPFAREISGVWANATAVNKTVLLKEVAYIPDVYHPERRWIVLEQSILNQTYKYPILSLQENGCRPKFSCLELKQRGPSVLRSRLGEVQPWPDYMAHLHDPTWALCGESAFEESRPSNLISGLHQYSVPCRLGEIDTMTLSLDTTLYVGGEIGFLKCGGTLSSHCQDPNRLTMIESSCPELFLPHDQFACLGSFTGKGGYQVVISSRYSDMPHDPFCWVFSPNFTHMHLIRGYDCVETTGTYLASLDQLQTGAFKVEVQRRGRCVDEQLLTNKTDEDKDTVKLNDMHMVAISLIVICVLVALPCIFVFVRTQKGCRNRKDKEAKHHHVEKYDDYE